jgi:SAM-dependent methyltransferase
MEPGYYEFGRPELLARIPRSARTILDVGCGAGRLGEAIKARQEAEVTGVELAETPAKAASGRLDRVLVGDVEEMGLPFATGSFDAIVCGDVLEHLCDPGDFLQRARDWLSANGRLIASIPNVRHHTVVRSLLDGNWTYESAGLLDRTHLRFFTRGMIEAIFQEAGFRVAQIDVVPGSGHAEWSDRGRPGEVGVGGLQVEAVKADEAEEFFTYQYLVTAEPARNGNTHIHSNGSEASRAATPKPTRKLRFMLLGDFSTFWRHETQTADALAELGHDIRRFHEHLMPSVDYVVAELNSGRYDCLLFYKGRIAARSEEETFAPTGEAIAEAIRRAKAPCYTWYVDRAYQFQLQPSREAWMRTVAPLCRVAFVAESALAQTAWARWHVLREPICHKHVQKLHVPEEARRDVAFLGQVYGSRAEELKPVAGEFGLQLISEVYGSALSQAIRGHKIVLGPRYPCVPGYWGNRLYVVLGHGGFFLAPEVQGMAEEGFVPGIHYAPLGDDPVADIRYWLARPEERERIARTGQELVLARFTYEHAARRLCRIIEETLA